MNSTDVNGVINNICDKLGTTASKLIPEMAGYQIAKHSIWLAVSLIFIGVCVGLTIKLLRMRKADGKMLALYPELVKKLDDRLKSSGILNEQIHPWSLREWEDTLDRVRRVVTTVNYDESTWVAMILTAVWSGLIGVVIFGIALYHIIGWCIAPNAGAFMWIINQFGGGQ
jgi:hypothetical protein